MWTGNNYKETVIAVTTTWAPAAIPFDSKRTNLVVHNTGANTLYYGLSEAGSIAVPAGAAVAFGADVPINALGLKADGATTAVVWEA